MTGHTPGDNDTPPPSSVSGISDPTSWMGPPPAEGTAAVFQPPGFPSTGSPGLQFQPVEGTQATHGGQAQPYAGHTQPYEGHTQPYGGYAQPYGAYPPTYGYGPPAPQPTNGLAIAALVVSCVAIAGLCGSGAGGLLGVVGATLGHVARGRISRSGEGGAGIALAGIIIGWVCTAIAVVIVAGIVWLAVNGSFGP